MQIRQTFSETFPPKPTFTEADLPSLTGKTYLITGGAAGIGKELARILYSANATVYIAGRNAANIEKAKKEIMDKPTPGLQPSVGKILPLIVDLADLPTIKPAVEELKRQVTAIDALFLNAGVMTPPSGTKTAQGYEVQWGTNVIGHFLFQQLMLPLMQNAARQNGESRIIWVASDGSKLSPAPDGIYWDDLNGDKNGLSPWNLYCQSKAGNIIVACEAARRYAADNIVVSSLNPGHLKTELQRHGGSFANQIANCTLLYDARFGALTELYAGFSDVVGLENNGAYLIPWGRVGEIAEHITKGMENGSGTRLWDLLEKETAQYA
jgi:retinol dehydrogenase 12